MSTEQGIHSLYAKRLISRLKKRQTGQMKIQIQNFAFYFAFFDKIVEREVFCAFWLRLSLGDSYDLRESALDNWQFLLYLLQFQDTKQLPQGPQDSRNMRSSSEK